MSNSDQQIMCSVYRSPKKEGMYVYVPKSEGVENLPDELIKQMGIPGHVMDLMLTPDRQLARVDVQEVMRNIIDKGFYLQMPPREGQGF